MVTLPFPLSFMLKTTILFIMLAGGQRTLWKTAWETEKKMVE
jgi:hypothetical protein